MIVNNMSTTKESPRRSEGMGTSSADVQELTADVAAVKVASGLLEAELTVDPELLGGVAGLEERGERLARVSLAVLHGVGTVVPRAHGDQADDVRHGVHVLDDDGEALGTGSVAETGDAGVLDRVHGENLS